MKENRIALLSDLLKTIKQYGESNHGYYNVNRVALARIVGCMDSELDGLLEIVDNLELVSFHYIDCGETIEIEFFN